MKTKSKKSMSNKMVAFSLIVTMIVSIAMSVPSLGLPRGLAANGGNAIPGYDTQAEATQAATELNIQLTGEGSVLLKNKSNALPLNKASSSVTVFGSAATVLQGGTGKVNEALAADGFKVNTTVLTEESVKSANAASVAGFADVAVVVLKRGGGEGSDLSVATSELANDAAENSGWTHERLAQNTAGKDVKHNQMLTSEELAMIAKAQVLCGKVVVLLNTSNAMEMYNLQNSDDADAIMFIGRPGANGIKAIPKLLSGEMTPSGKLADEWMRDFSSDPTWYNSIANVQNDAGSNSYILPDGTQASSISMHGIDYSEDIYLGYKYYETVYAEILAGNLSYTDSTLAKGTGNKAQADAWFADNVVYAFGYGMSYTNFEISIKSISETDLTAKQIQSSAFSPAKVKTVALTVQVKNTGSVQGKEVVQIYSQAPYTVDGIEKASVNLVAYGKTNTLKPGESQVIKLDVNLQDMASYDYADANENGFKGYELENGEYNLYASNTSHCTNDTAKSTLKIIGDAKLALDDFSDNEVENLFSKENGRNNSLRSNDTDWNGDGKIDDSDIMFTSEQILLSRKDMVGTFPVAPVTTVDNVAVSTISEFDITKAYVIGDVVKITEVTSGVTGSSSVSYYKFKSAHAAGAFVPGEAVALSGEYKGGLVVTQEFAELMDYYAKFNLNLWETTTPYFNPANAYKTGDKFGIDGTKEIYQATKNTVALPAITVDSSYEVNSYLLSDSPLLGRIIYKVTKNIAKITFIDNGDFADAKATKAYSEGDYVTYMSTSFNGARSNSVKITAPIAIGNSFNTKTNCATFSATMRLVTTGDDKNVEEIAVADYVTTVIAPTKTADVNNGAYTYSDKLFTGTSGVNGYGGEDGLFDVSADMMKGWEQVESSDSQSEERVAAGDSWIYFNQLNGIKFDDNTMITTGKFAGKTGTEVWNAFMNQWTWNDFYTACWNGGNNGRPIDNLGIPDGGVADSPTSWNKTYTWCCNTTIAQTWNIDLGETQGSVTADMGLLKNLTETTKRDQWLNPAINTHRTPFSGRNNEYYSQDGYHGGWMAQAVVKGIQSRGVGSHLKHMFLNDQETSRNAGDLMAWVSEQAIREIYVKPFQMGIQEGGAEGAMSAFARIGSVPTPVSDNMCNLLVRKEWGATDFFFHPDMYSPQANVSSEDLMLRTGHNHAPGGSNITNQGTPANNTFSGRWDATYENELTGTVGGVYIGRDNEATGQESYYSNNQWYIMRYSAMIMYSEYANQAHAQNGMIVSEWTGGNYGINAKDKTNLDVGFDGAKQNATVFKYEITEGALPAGLTLNATTGIISGSATEAGTFTFTVKGTFDKWIAGSAEYTITVGHGSIVSSIVNDKGEFVVTYADGTTENLGVVVGDNGQDGAAGQPGADGAAGANGTDGANGANGKDAAGGCNGSIVGTGWLQGLLIVLSLGLGSILLIKRKKQNN